MHREMTPEEFDSEFLNLWHQSAFRLETLPHYESELEDAHRRRFYAGEHVDTKWLDPWRQMLTQVSGRGGRMARVRVLAEPLTSYLLFETGVIYPVSVQHGEDVRILVTDRPEAFGPDFWLLDNQVAHMIYSPAGEWLGVLLDDDTDVVAQAQERASALLAKAVPLKQYLTKENIR